MAGYVLSVAADLDLDEIWEYIAADNIDAADRWIGKRSMRAKPSHVRRAWAINAKTLLIIRCCSGRSAPT
jgi:plasmid stabilization system protein ParE